MSEPNTGEISREWALDVEGVRKRVIEMQRLSLEQRAAAVEAAQPVLRLAEEYLGDGEVVYRTLADEPGRDITIRRSRSSESELSPISVQRMTYSMGPDGRVLENGEAWLFASTYVGHTRYYSSGQPGVSDLMVREDSTAEGMKTLEAKLRTSQQKPVQGQSMTKPLDLA